MSSDQALRLLDILANLIGAVAPDRNDLGEAITNLRNAVAYDAELVGIDAYMAELSRRIGDGD